MNEATRLLAVDFGRVRIGLALSDPDRKFAFPHAILERRDPAKDAAFFAAFVAEQEIGRIVVGLPLHLDGRESEKAKEARAFGAWLAEVADKPVVFWDERYSTVEAEALLRSAGLTDKKRKQRLDSLAAQRILQHYIEAGCPMESSSGALDE